MDFENLADVPMIDEVQDDDTVLVVRDGEVFRADGSNLGGGGYAVKADAADMHIIEDDDVLIVAVDTAVPDIMDAVNNRVPMSLIFDANELFLNGALEQPLMATATMCSSGAVKQLSELVFDTTINADCLIFGVTMLSAIGAPLIMSVLFTDGHYEELFGDEAASVSTLSLDDETTTENKLTATLKKLREKWEARKNGSVENTN